MNDVGKLLWTLMSYIVFVLVHLYLRLSENVLPCEFHRHWGFLYIARRHFIVYDSGPYFICHTRLHNGCIVMIFFELRVLFSDPCCRALVTSSSHCCV